MTRPLHALVMAVAVSLYLGVGMGIATTADLERLNRCGDHYNAPTLLFATFGWPIVLTAGAVVGAMNAAPQLERCP